MEVIVSFSINYPTISGILIGLLVVLFLWCWLKQIRSCDNNYIKYSVLAITLALICLGVPHLSRMGLGDEALRIAVLLGAQILLWFVMYEICHLHKIKKV